MINFNKIQNTLYFIYFIYFFIVYSQLLPFMCILLTPFYKNKILYLYGKYTIENILKVKSIITKDAEYIESGFILANHRSIFDGWIDPYLCKGIIVSRRFAYFAFLPMILLYEINYGNVMITRGKDNRQKIYEKIKNKIKLKSGKVLFFPEGSRLRYNTLNSYEEIKCYLKYGILKEIYNDKENLPVQLQISSNKELVLDERIFKIRKGIVVKTHITKPIYPADFQNEQDFYDSIAKEWYNAWKITHNDVNLM
jgi:1-acyl-sn-glycerol-3-phosphate acyltransferase